MSGGYFNYDQYRIRTIAGTIRSIIDNNTKKDQWGYASNYNEETLKYFERAIEILKIAEVYIQRIDWLVSGDDGEETFMKRLHKELAEIKAIPIEPLVSLPCPFCANTKIRTWQTEDEYWHIQCNSDVCGACMDDFTTEQEAIKQWNVRSN